jgi:hypothetical protein
LARPGPDVQNLPWERDVDRADGLAGVTGNAETLGADVVLKAVVKRRIHKANCSAVDVAENVTADHGV